MPTGDSNDQQSSTTESFSDLPQETTGLIAEFIEFLRFNKKWWLAPIMVIMLLLTLLAFLTASPVAPFIYTLF